MTIDHRAAAELMLSDADEWAAQAGELNPEGELSCLAYAAVHALLAIHDALTAADRYAANEAKQREAAQEATGGDLSASGSENGAEEGGDADDAQKAILCPECGDHINMHNKAGCWHFLCVCPRTPQDIARAPTADAVKVDAELSRLLAVSTDPTAALRRAAMMEAVGVTDDQAKWFAQILAKGRLLPRDLQRLKAAVEQTGDGRG